ncbi:hypothetical protein AVEN_17445-1 [Araneus ventricosus]|uniref:Secreted protein n=1 Tax=Araneus ventricosus TaxID=182803 RepID=A0A4Y2VT87_ARAVE|nr:hypothetical protein AVEN_17445-1 [Araneus ventricosus]
MKFKSLSFLLQISLLGLSSSVVNDGMKILLIFVRIVWQCRYEVSLPCFAHASGPCRTLELYSRRKALVNISWRHPPAHSWYRCEGPGAAIRFKGDRRDQTALARLSSSYLKTLRFSRGDKKFNICTK